MKFRHILPWIPIIGIVWVFSFSFYSWEKRGITSGDIIIKYIWGGHDAYIGSAFIQAIGSSILLTSLIF